MIPAFIAAAFALAPQDFEVAPMDVPWTDLEYAFFDPGWLLPEQSGGRDLEAEMRRLADLSFEEGDRQRSFGDLVVEARQLDPRARSAWLADLDQRAPKLAFDWGGALGQLLLDDHLKSADWHPDEDHPRDGLLTAEGWELERGGAGPWQDLSPRFEQAATLLNADLATIKRVENDYRSYLEHIGSSYLEINPLPGGHLRSVDDTQQPLRFVRIRFRCDLPFPFSSYTCDLRILNRIDADSSLRTDIYSTSSDFNYMAGRDVFLPVRDSSGKEVAYLLVRSFGFDLDNVPDRARHRAEALRSALGNLKRKAERAFEPDTIGYPTAAEVLSELRVMGRR